MIDAKITLSWPAKLDPEGRELSYIVDEECIYVRSYSLAGVKRDLKEALEDRVHVALDAQRGQNQRVAMIAGGSGDVAMVVYSHGAWGYSFFGRGRSLSGGGTHGFETFEEAAVAAEKHIDDAFGGVAWRTNK